MACLFQVLNIKYLKCHFSSVHKPKASPRWLAGHSMCCLHLYRLSVLLFCALTGQDFSNTTKRKRKFIHRGVSLPASAINGTFEAIERMIMSNIMYRNWWTTNAANILRIGHNVATSLHACFLSHNGIWTKWQNPRKLHRFFVQVNSQQVCKCHYVAPCCWCSYCPLDTGDISPSNNQQLFEMRTKRVKLLTVISGPSSTPSIELLSPSDTPQGTRKRQTPTADQIQVQLGALERQ